MASQGARTGRAEETPPLLDIWTWGRNDQGQLGQVPQNANVPWPMHEARRWVTVSSSGDHTLALDDAGDIWAWGRNHEGQLGDGTTRDSFLPVHVQGLSGVTLVAAGTLHSLAYRASDGTLWAWGSNASGQLARGADVASSSVPVAIAVPAPLAAIATGSVHSLLMTVDGAVYAWGPNQYGQLGSGDFDDRRAPSLVNLPSAAIAIGAGGSHSAAALADGGRVYTWGWNVFGQLGRGFQGTPDVGEPVPAPVPSVTDAVQVSLGDLHCLVRTQDGHVWAWGYNTEGQVGNGAVTPAYTGVLAPALLPLDSVASIDAGGLHSLAVTTSGELWAWGNNQFGAVGNNARSDQRSPTRVVGIPKVFAAAGGGRHSVALVVPRTTTRVVEYGVTSKDAPEDAGAEWPAHELSGIRDIAAARSGFSHTLLLDGAHRVWAFGENDHGQLGVPGPSSVDPVAVAVPLDGLEGIVQIEARGNRSLALRSDGAVFTWGEGTWGALGLGGRTDVSVPTRVDLAEPVTRLAAGERHTLALDRTGSIWAWGQNLHGELGMAASAERLTPVRVLGGLAPSMIVAGAYHNLALDISGALYAWGSGFRGQLGNGTLFDSATPLLVPIPRNVTGISGGRFHSLVVQEGGGVLAFGDNTECQIATWPTLDSVAFPIPVTAVGPALAAVAGDYHSVALEYSGDVSGWGNDSAGQLGRPDGTLPHYDCVPASVGDEPANVVGAGATRSFVGVRAASDVTPAAP